MAWNSRNIISGKTSSWRCAVFRHKKRSPLPPASGARHSFIRFVWPFSRCRPFAFALAQFTCIACFTLVSFCVSDERLSTSSHLSHDRNIISIVHLIKYDLMLAERHSFLLSMGTFSEPFQSCLDVKRWAVPSEFRR